jgi:hypothetical protein
VTETETPFPADDSIASSKALEHAGVQDEAVIPEIACVAENVKIVAVVGEGVGKFLT